MLPHALHQRGNLEAPDKQTGVYISDTQNIKHT